MKCLFSLVLGGLIAAQSAAGSVNIVNPSFEAQPLSPGAFFYSPTTITGWLSTATGAPDRGVWNTLAPGKDGDNIAFLYRNNAMAQQLDATVQTDTIYQLSYLMGRVGQNNNRGTAELWAGGTVANGVVTGGTLLASATHQPASDNMLAFTLN